MEASSSRSLAAADDLDSTVLRHQVERYFNELQQDADTPLNMDFLGIKKRRPAVSSTSRPQPGTSSQLRTPAAAESFMPKKFRFDNTATGEMSSMTEFNSSLFSSSRRAPVSGTASHSHERQLSEKQAEIVALQQKLVEMEMKLGETQTGKRRLETELINLKDALQTQARHSEDQIEDLMMEIEHLKSRNDALIKENQEKKEKADYWKLFCSEEKLRHGREQSEMQELLTDERTQHEEEISRLKRELESAQWDAKKLQLEAEEKQSEIQILKTRLENNVAPSCDHESVMEQQRQVIVAMENALFAQRSTTSASQEAKLARIPQMEKEIIQLQQTNQLLRDTAANELLLKEQISSLQTSVQRYKEHCSTIPYLENEVKRVKEQLHQWEQMSRLLFETESVPAVRIQVEEMRRRELGLVEEVGNLRLDLNSISRLNTNLQEQIAALKEGSKGRAELEERVRKLERKLSVVQKDRDHYRAVNEMYESEMTRVGAPATASKETLQIRELEKLLDDYRSLISSSSGGDALELSTKNQQLNQEIAQLKAEIASASSMAQSSSDTKVIHFSSNPLDNARVKTLEQLKQLEKENESLRERIRLMTTGQTQNLTLLVGEHFEEGCTPERLKDLEERLKSSELKNQRVEEVFRKYCSDFRRGIFELFGYQVDNDECGNFKLTSVFSESNQDYLSFKYVGDGLMVMDSPYVHTIDDLVQTHITNQKSIPIFLASHQIDLFSRHSSTINSSSASMMLTTPG